MKQLKPWLKKVIEIICIIWKRVIDIFNSIKADPCLIFLVRLLIEVFKIILTILLSEWFHYFFFG